jgi:hypothetical protein
MLSRVMMGMHACRVHGVVSQETVFWRAVSAGEWLVECVAVLAASLYSSWRAVFGFVLSAMALPAPSSNGNGTKHAAHVHAVAADDKNCCVLWRPLGLLHVPDVKRCHMGV